MFDKNIFRSVCHKNRNDFEKSSVQCQKIGEAPAGQNTLEDNREGGDTKHQ